MKWIIALLLALAVAGCAPTGQQVKTEAPRPPVFDWNPTASAKPASVDITFGIVGGSYANEKEDWVNDYPMNTFRDNMRSDFNELMTARGFKTTGPFLNVDEMTYPDKKACELILQPTLDIQLAVPTITAEEHVKLMGTNYFTLNGVAIIGGRVTFSVVESLSGTRMWNKSVAIAPASVPWTGEQKYVTPPQGGFMLRNEPGLQKALAPYLERAYNDILNKAWDYLNPEEMAVVKQQAMEVKEKTTFSGNK